MSWTQAAVAAKLRQPVLVSALQGCQMTLSQAFTSSEHFLLISTARISPQHEDGNIDYPQLVVLSFELQALAIC